MRHTRARLRPLVAVPVLALALSACGGSAPSTGSNGGSIDPNKQVTLNVWGGYPEMDAVYKKAGDAYHAKHPNVTVTVFSTDLRGFEQKLTTALPSNSAGDVIVRTSDFLSRFIDQNLFSQPPADLQGLVSGGAYNKSTVDDVTYNGKLWSVPEFLGRSALYYNKDMLAEVGLTDPPKTMDDIVSYARKLAKKDASGNVTRAGLSLRLSGQGSGVAEKYWIWLEQYGHGLIKETSPGKWVADYNNADGVKTLQMYVDLLRDKIDDPNIAHDAQAFETKAAAMFVRESWVNGEIAQKAPDLVGHYASAPMPVASISQTESMFVPAASQNQAVAWDFIKFLTEQEQQMSIADIAGWLPARV
ncbi:MAG TPA: extracellular solute-binding protein, partial [Candidatus Limnocylindrales bacterium]|nr:extracellular solute-binding protein [Candidatus Limnocylindrales bacterium]